MATDGNGMLDELLNDDSDSMTAWDVEFIESVDKQRKRRGFEISGKQEKIIVGIYERVFDPR